jgi:hypothetical protein
MTASDNTTTYNAGEYESGVLKTASSAESVGGFRFGERKRSKGWDTFRQHVKSDPWAMRNP